MATTYARPGPAPGVPTARCTAWARREPVPHALASIGLALSNGLKPDAYPEFMVKTLTVNGSEHMVAADDDMPLLWVLRDELGLTGTKYGCGIGACGSCSVLVDGVAVRSCLVRVADVTGPVTTIEGLGTPEAPHSVQAVWIDHQVAQCGYCQPGQIVTAVSLLARLPDPSDEDIDAAFAGNLCRCGTYVRIRRAVHAAAERLKAAG